MLPDSKKRKTSDTAEAVESNTYSKEELRKKLVTFEKAHVVRTLIESLGAATPAQVDAVQALLAPLLTSADPPLHCVRCHDEYRESQNTSMTQCTFEHMDGEYFPIEGRDGERELRFPCCGVTVDESQLYGFEEMDEEIRCCDVDYHTTNPEEVVYYDEKTKTGNEYIRSCKDNGCDL